MTKIYGNVKPVTYSIWKEEDETEPSIEVDNAKIEEMYYDKSAGKLFISIIHDDRCIYVDIPVLANNDWNDFVQSLPEWDNE